MPHGQHVQIGTVIQKPRVRQDSCAVTGIPTIVQKWKLSLQGSYGDKQMLRDSHGDGKKYAGVPQK